MMLGADDLGYKWEATLSATSTWLANLSVVHAPAEGLQLERFYVSSSVDYLYNPFYRAATFNRQDFVVIP